MKVHREFIWGFGIAGFLGVGASFYGLADSWRSSVPATPTPTPAPAAMPANGLERAVLRTVEFENDHVVMVRLKLPPHAKISMHDSPDLVAVWLTDARLRLTFPDGKSKVERHRAGDMSWLPAEQQAGENLSGSPLEFISVQLKDSSPGRNQAGDGQNVKNIIPYI